MLPQRSPRGLPWLGIRLFACIFNENQMTLMGHAGGVHGVAFSPDGKRIVSGSLTKR